VLGIDDATSCSGCDGGLPVVEGSTQPNLPGSGAGSGADVTAADAGRADSGVIDAANGGAWIEPVLSPERASPGSGTGTAPGGGSGNEGGAGPDGSGTGSELSGRGGGTGNSGSGNP